MKIKIGISPCPNDTFIFNAIHSKQIDISPFEFEFIFEDVETLNKLALKAELDVIKLSYANYLNVLDSYVMLRSGGALGNGVGPLLIAKKNHNLNEIEQLNIAIPGQHTTAHFLLNFAFPSVQHKKEYLFSSIENAVAHDEVDAGVIIHENRFTYQEKGLIKLIDLGEYWEQHTSLPIPLGGIAIRRNMNEKIKSNINQLIALSVEQGRETYPMLSQFVINHAQEMSQEVMRNHIELYVNQFSIDIGAIGEEAVRQMAKVLNIQSQHNLFI